MVQQTRKTKQTWYNTSVKQKQTWYNTSVKQKQAWYNTNIRNRSDRIQQKTQETTKDARYNTHGNNKNVDI